MQRKLSFRNLEDIDLLELSTKITPHMKNIPDHELVNFIDDLLEHKFHVYSKIENNIFYVIIETKLNVFAMTN